MRRSSRAALGASVIVILGAAALYTRAQDRPAPPFSEDVVRRLVAAGNTALERGDAGAIDDLIAPNAHIMRFSKEQIGRAVSQAIGEISPRKLSVTASKIEVHPARNAGWAAFDLLVSERSGTANIDYFRTRLRIEVVRVRASRWLGLYTTEDWKISALESDPPLPLPYF